jgi:WD40 repeat protein
LFVILLSCSVCLLNVRVEFPADTVECPLHLTGVAAHPTSPFHLICPSTDGLCRVFDLRSNLQMIDLLCHSTERASATQAIFSHDGGLIYTGGNDRVVKVWDARQTASALESIRCAAVPSRFSLSRRTNTLVIPMHDRRTKICDSQGTSVGVCDTHKTAHRGILTSAEWSEDESFIFTSSSDQKSLCLWECK